MKVNGVEIKKAKTSVLEKHRKMYTILIPFYFAFAGFFGYVGLMEPPMDEMWMVPLIGLAGAAAFIAAAVYMIRIVRAIKGELRVRVSAASAQAAKDAASASEEMKAYQALLEQGVLTQAEYDAELAERSRQK